MRNCALLSATFLQRARLITILIKRIEAYTGKKWIADAATGAAVREEVGNLIDSLVPAAKERVVASPELRKITQDLIVVVAHLYQTPRPTLALLGDDDWAALAVIAKDLGPALLRNYKTAKTRVTIREVKGRQKQ